MMRVAGRPGPFLRRSTVTLTSSNGTTIGAFGLLPGHFRTLHRGILQNHVGVQAAVFFDQISMLAFDDSHDTTLAMAP